MSSSEHQASSASTNTLNEESLKLAIAISLLRSKLSQRHSPSSQSDDAPKWKQKAKERKLEIIKLKDDLKEAEDASQCDLFPSSDAFRLRERRKTAGSSQKRRAFGFSDEDQAGQLMASVDFLVELCSSNSPVQESKFKNWSHQAVDFILASLKNLLSIGKNLESIEGVVSQLNYVFEANIIDTNSQFYIQHLLPKLGCESYIGQRVILSISQRISVLAESILFSDPFDTAFPAMHECMFLMIQLVEFLVLNYLLTWSTNEGFENILEIRNGLYVLYMDRVIGELTKLVGQDSVLQKLNPGMFDALLH